jgi:DNA-binding ferritin-like protein
MKNLMSILKIATSNLGVLHRNVYGSDFFNVHEILEEYYKLISNMTDDIIELFMSIREVEPGLEEAMRAYAPIKPEPIKSFLALSTTKEIFQDIIRAIDIAKERLPHDITDRLEEYKRLLRKEADYKLARATNSFN